MTEPEQPSQQKPHKWWERLDKWFRDRFKKRPAAPGVNGA